MREPRNPAASKTARHEAMNQRRQIFNLSLIAGSLMLAATATTLWVLMVF